MLARARLLEALRLLEGCELLELREDQSSLPEDIMEDLHDGFLA